MNRNEIDALVDSFIVNKARGKVEPRVQKVVVRLLRDLFKAIEDLDLQPSEVWHGLEYIADCGRAHEIGLLAAGLGLERFMDIRSDEAEARVGLKGGTPRTIEGPLYVIGAPVCMGTARLDDDTEGDRAEVLLMQGIVRVKKVSQSPVHMLRSGMLIPSETIRFLTKPSQHLICVVRLSLMAKGRYRFRSILPAGYGCPPEGPTQQLLNKLGRHGRRPAHIHFFISARGYRKLTTQINIAGDEYLWDDFAFASREGLVPQVNKITAPEQIAASHLSKPYTSIDFDFTLYQQRKSVPDSEVDRLRASAVNQDGCAKV